MRIHAASSPVAALMIGAAISAGVFAQTTPPPLPFSIKVQQGTTVTNATDGSLISFQAGAIGQPNDALVSITHLGITPATPPNALPVGMATITAIDVSGATDFSVSNIPDPTQSFPPNQGFTLDVRYKPITSLHVQGIVKISYTEQLPAVNFVTPKPTMGSFSLNLSGVAPEFNFTYQPPPGNNAVPIQTGGAILFGMTNVNDTPVATVTVNNIGSGPGVVSGVTLTTASADLTSVNFPAPGTSVDTMKSLSFGVRFFPMVVETVTGTVRIDFIDHSVTFNVSATSQGPVFAYDVLSASSATPVLPGQTITLPDTSVTATTPGTVVVRVRNVGTADAHIASIDVSGAGFTLTQVPFVPLTLTAGTSASVTVNFTPTQPGPVSGGLRIGTDTFVLTGNGLGQNLVYAFVAGGITTAVQNNGSVIFPPVAVGGTSTLVFQITNSGTAPGSVNSISIGAATPSPVVGTTPAPPSSTPIFSLSKAPSLPATIAAGDTLTFTLTFAPNAVGISVGILRIDSLNFPVSGVANQPDPMPDYHFTGATGAQDSLQQVATGLTLAAPYSLNLNGTLTLTFNSDVFSNDPAVQFAVGGRTVNFVIPAGTTQAVFPNNASQLGLQTGTVAGTITLTPSFVTDGGINLTPTNPPSLNLTVAQSAPRLLSVQLSSKTTNALTLLITGYATGRSITEIDIQFTPVSGENVTTTHMSLSVSPSFTAWYQSTQSQQFGSQFTVSLPLNLAGDVINVTNLTDTISAASVTLTNNQGVSSAQTVALQ